LDKKNNLAVSAFNYGSTGEGYQIYDSNKGSTFISEQYVPELGINLGNIISRPGSGAWSWCDVHSTDKGMKIPLMTTVIFSNYASNIYGKQNNNWVLKNSITGDVLLDVKETPYFIYTFTSAGNYTIYNSVEDSFGNVYATTKPGYIEVVNHKEKNPDDKNPNLVDSFDYGQPEPFPGRDYQVRKLAKDLMIEQNKILKSGNQQFGSDIDMPDNPDATFRS
jgi:PKD repeat protein